MLICLGMAGLLAVTSKAVSAQGAPAAVATRQGPNQSTGLLAIVGAGQANLYDAPGGNIVKTMSAGAVMTAVGRTADSKWVVVYTDDGVAGWVEVSQVVLFGVDQLPVMAEATGAPVSVTAPASAATVELPTPTFTPMPTPTPTSPPTPTPTPSPTPSPTPLPAPTSVVAGIPGGVSTGALLQAGLIAVVRSGGAELLDMPNGTVMQTLATGTAITAQGRTADDAWLSITTSTGATGWIGASKVVIFDLTNLPIVTVAGASASAATPNIPSSTIPQTAPSSGMTEATALPATAAPAAAATPSEPALSPPVISAGEVAATVTVTDARLNMRSGPGTVYAIIGKAQSGQVFVATGRNNAGTWVLLQASDSSQGAGWVAVQYVSLSQPVMTLPVSNRIIDPTNDASVSPVSPAPVVAASVGSPVGGMAGLKGNLVFQTNSGSTIYVFDLSTGGLRSLTGGFDPAVSPDGRIVAFTRLGGDHGLYLINIDGSNERLIYSGNGDIRAPTWSPDGQWIAFTRAAGEYECRDLGFGICIPDSPFLKGFPLAHRPEWGLSRVDSNGQNFRDINALTSTHAPSWGQGGIVYQATTSLEITQDTPNGQTHALATVTYYEDPDWQPGGDRIVFQSREGSHWEIFAINADGTGTVALTRPVTTLVNKLPSNVAPAWSPDGKTIAYLSSRTADNSDGPWRIWVMNADGSDQHPLSIDNLKFNYTFTADQMISWGKPVQ